MYHYSEHTFEQAMAETRGSGTIVKGASLLRQLLDGASGVTRLSRALRLSKSTTHRLLRSLETASLVVQDPISQQYSLGPLLYELASRSLAGHQTLILCAAEEMTYLRDLSRETVALYIRLGRERICLDEVESQENIKFTAGRGCTFPLHMGSSGKVLLSELEDGDLTLVLRNVQWAPMGPGTITDKAAFLRELKKTRKLGYATSFSERVAGGASICVPIGNYVCPVAMSVLGPDNRLTREVMLRLLDEIKAAAGRISRKLAAATHGLTGR